MASSNGKRGGAGRTHARTAGEAGEDAGFRASRRAGFQPGVRCNSNASVLAWLSYDNSASDFLGPTRDGWEGAGMVRLLCSMIKALFAGVGWFGFRYKMLRAGFVCEDYMRACSANGGDAPDGWWDKICIRCGWRRNTTAEAYIKSLVMARFDKSLGRIDRERIVSLFDLRVIMASERRALADVNAGNVLKTKCDVDGFVVAAELKPEDEAERWRLDNGPFGQSPYYRAMLPDDSPYYPGRDVEPLLEALRRLFFPSWLEYVEDRYAWAGCRVAYDRAKARCVEQAANSAEVKALLTAKGIRKATHANAARVAEVDAWVRKEVGEAWALRARDVGTTFGSTVRAAAL